MLYVGRGNGVRRFTRMKEKQLLRHTIFCPLRKLESVLLVRHGARGRPGLIFGEQQLAVASAVMRHCISELLGCLASQMEFNNQINSSNASKLSITIVWQYISKQLILLFNQSSAYDLKSRHAVAEMHSGQ